MLAIRNREGYVSSFLYKRLIKTLVNFDIAVVMYLAVGLLRGIRYDALTVIGSFIGITSVGNSNWYIFAILILYLFSYISALTLKSDYTKQLVLISTLTVAYIAIMWILGFEMRYYSTVMCYPLGCFLALYKDKLLLIFRKKKTLIFMLLTTVIVATYKLRFNAIVMNISSIAFVCAMVWFLCFFKMKSNILYFFGKHAFSIFILQRIPGILLREYLGTGRSKYVIVAVDFIITIGIALLYDKYLFHIDGIIVDVFNRKRNNECKV